MEKEFLDFIKSAQRFYRGYIQRLASRYHGVRQLEIVAHNMTLSSMCFARLLHQPPADFATTSTLGGRTD